MNYIGFKNRYQDTPVINLASLQGLSKNPVSLTSNVNKWVKKGYLYRLRNNLYALNDNDRKAGLSRLFIANNIYTPSYVSLEYAMFYHGLIPETVYEITSVSTAKTASFNNHFGVFTYSTIKKELFFGVLNVKDENSMPVFIAEPEKALLDFVYTRFCRGKNSADAGVFVKKNRVQNAGGLDKKKYSAYLMKYPATCRESLKQALKEAEK